MEKSTESHPLAENEDLLGKLKIFAELSHEELTTLVSQSSRAHFAPGERIINWDDEGFCMYVILKGTVTVSRPSDSGEVELASLDPGDFFGEVALVDDGPRSANVTATTDCELLCITRTTLGVLAGLQPGAAIQLLAAIGRCLVARLREGNQKYMDLMVLNRQPA